MTLSLEQIGRLAVTYTTARTTADAFRTQRSASLTKLYQHGGCERLNRKPDDHDMVAVRCFDRDAYFRSWCPACAEHQKLHAAYLSWRAKQGNAYKKLKAAVLAAEEYVSEIDAKKRKGRINQ